MTRGDWPLSPGQKALWFLYHLAPDSSAYNVVGLVRVREPLEPMAIQRSFQRLARRHGPLGAAFLTVDGEPRQRPVPGAPIDFAAADASDWSEERIRGWLEEEVHRPFDLQRDPMLRVRFLHAPGASTLLLVTVHHIVSDFWSLGVLMRELGFAYGEETGGPPADLPPLRRTYFDWVRQQEEMLAGPEGERLWGYWRERLAGGLPALELPTDRPRPPVQTFHGAVRTLRLPPAAVSALRALGRSRKATLFATLLAGFQVLLRRLTGQEDLLVGSPAAGRGAREWAGLVGYFVNPVVLRGDLSGDPAFGDHLARTRAVALEAFEHQQYPFQLLAERLQPERDPGRSPVFQVMFALQKVPVLTDSDVAGFALGEEGARLTLGRLTFESFRFDQRTSQFDLTLFAAEAAGGNLWLSFQFNTDLFDAATAERLLARLEVLLRAAAADPLCPVSALPLLPEAELHQLLTVWNDTGSTGVPERLHDAFLRQAEATPDAVALVYGERRLSYGELRRRSAGLARRLRGLGVGPEVRVGVCARRTPEMVSGLLAVLQAGGAYVPLDPAYPAERLAFMAEDAGVAAVLADAPSRASLPAGGFRVVPLDEEESEAEPVADVPGAGPDNLAYLIYTSGSTGRPKGVAIEHRSAAALLRWAAEVFTPRELAAVLASTSINFDLSVYELFVPLAAGGTVVLAANALALPRDAGVTLINTVPSALSELLRSGPLPPSVATVNLAGEPLQRTLVDRAYAAGRVERVFNLYGPSEDTTYSTWAWIGRDEDGPPSIGRPLRGTRAFVVDRAFRLAPAGAVGELWLGGEGLARGYLGRPGLTAERFVPDPFGAGPGARLYRTGDLARHRGDGRLALLGRADHQVKVRGFRIELGEVERALDSHPGLLESVVVAGEDAAGERALIAYVVFAGEAVPAAELRAALRRWLPEHMVPSWLVPLPALPRTPNGKVDRKALPAPDAAGVAAEGPYTAPRTPAEEVLAQIWAGVLGLERVGITDNFFDLGGHSLKAVQVVSRIRDAFGADLPVRRVFEAPTVAGLAARVEEERGVPGEEVPPLVPAGREVPPPLSFGQRRLWFLDRLEPGDTSYHLPAALRCRGRLDVPALERALAGVMRRHEVLRTTVAERGGEPVQVIAPPAPPRLQRLDLSGLPEARREAEALAWAAVEARRPFDLMADPPLRTALVTLGPGDHLLLLTLHHIAADGWSLDILAAELSELYDAALAGRDPALRELPVHYADFAVWQRRWLRGEALEVRLAWWREVLAGVATLDLPSDRPRPALLVPRGARVPFALPAELTAGLRELGRRAGATPFMTLLAAFQTLLGRGSGQEDVAVGSPVAGRMRPELEGLIGFFVNTLVLRGDLSGDPSFLELLGRTREMTLGAYVYQELPFEKLVEELQPQRDPSRSPLFQVLFALRNTQPPRLVLPDAETAPVEIDPGEAKFDLAVSLEERDDGEIAGWIKYHTDLFDRPTLARLAEHLATLLRGAVEDPGRPLSVLPLLGEAERHQLLLAWNDTAEAWEEPRRLHELVAAQAARTPDAVAVVFEGRHLSHGELGRRSCLLAGHLRRLGVGPETLAAVCMERSPELLVALLGVLEAGGAYVSLDPGYPAERLAFMLDDAQAPVVLSQGRLARLLPAGARAVLVDADWPEIAAGRPLASPLAVPEEGLAYLIYTSGSTGRPKGAMNTHRGICNRLVGMQRIPGLTLSAGDRLLQKTPLGFDVSVFELFWPLFTGACLVLARPEGHRDPAYLRDLIGAEEVTSAHFVPSMLRAFLEQDGLEAACSSLRRVFCGGEALTLDLRERFFGRLGARLFNFYGPAEAAVDVSSWECERGSGRNPVPIGRPVPNIRMRVLDRGLRPVPVGVPGELCLSGVGVGRGYWRRPELTAERFVPDPYDAEGGGRIYRTGDAARLSPDGAVEFLGRLDFQVKVRGVRVELGEIEAALAAHPGLRRSAVVAREDVPGDVYLAAYLVAAREEARPGAAELRSFLAAGLPEVMVPSVFVYLEALPLSPSGKVDRRALPAPDRAGEPERACTPPRTPDEELLAGIWAGVLGVERIGVEDDFFDLGGHSLKAVQVVSRVREAFGVELPVRRLFESPTLAALAERIGEERRGGEPQAVPPLVPAPREVPPPLSFGQRRLWFLDRLDPGSPSYHLPAALRCRGPLRVDALEQALAEVVRRHEVLRTTFAERGGEPVQVIAPPGPWRLERLDLGGLGEDEALRRAAAEARRPFDLAADPPLRATLMALGPEDHLLVLVLHHIAADGWSVDLLAAEVSELYETEGRKPELPVQYADFAVWQRGWLEGEALERRLAWWRRNLEGIAALDLPTDRPRPATPTLRGARRPFALPAALAGGLRGLCRRAGVTLFMTVLAAFQTLLSRGSGQTDVAVGSPVAGRVRPELEGLIGFFVNTLVLRGDLSGDPTFLELLARTREATLGAFACQDLPFEKLVEELQPQRDLSRGPLFQVLFVFQSARRTRLSLAGVEVELRELDPGATKLDLSLAVEERDGRLAGWVEHSTELFDPPTVLRLAERLGTLLQGAVADPGRRLSELSLLGDAERHQLLLGWNDTARDYDSPHLLHERIAAQIERTPEAVAAVFEGEHLSYGELGRRAGLLAGRLQRLGVGPEVPVAVCMERSLELVTALLGTLAAGGAYVPLDPGYPTERLAFMREDSRAPVLLSQERLAGLLPAGSSVLLDADWPAAGDPPPPVRMAEEGLAYVIYTSGSTGRPKGAMNSHRGISNRLLWMQERYGLTGDDRVLQKTPFSFDVSVWEFFWPLLTGACLVVARPEGHRDPAYLRGLIDREEVTTLHFVPSMLRVFLEQEGLEAGCASLRRVICSGEALPPDLVTRFFARSPRPTAELHNLYGPTEAAVDVSAWECARGDGRPAATVPIGRPIANLALRVLDHGLRPVPIGVPGELYLGGVGVGRGYQGRPELTAERFVPDPFGAPGARLYRTGDAARLLPGGAVEFLGRLDFQVKVRGFRIELGEVESALAAHPGLRESAVVAREAAPGELSLAAYLVARSETRPAAGELRSFLGASLPEYMVPSAFVYMDEMPLSPAGKLDRRALPSPDAARPDRERPYVAPRTTTEQALAGIWAELLGVPKIGTEDDFFDLGGHSLKAVQLVSRIRDTIGIELPLRSLFAAPRLSDLARDVDSRGGQRREPARIKALPRGAGGLDELLARAQGLARKSRRSME